MTALIQDNLVLIVALFMVVAAIESIGLLMLVRRLGGLRRRLDALTRGDDGRSLQSLLEAHIGRVVEIDAEVQRLTGRAAALEVSGRRAFQRIGLVRFNPFDDTGGNQSFALVLLDAEDDGLVLSSLHSRTGTRMYAKGIAGGRPEAALSDEETEALGLARGASAGRVALAERTGAWVGGR